MVGLVLAVAAFWLAVLGVVFHQSGSSWREFLGGRLEPLPDDLGSWREWSERPADGLLGEERYLLAPGGVDLLVQRRYRDAATGSIVRSEPEVRVRRRRIRRSRP